MAALETVRDVENRVPACRNLPEPKRFNAAVFECRLVRRGVVTQFIDLNVVDDGSSALDTVPNFEIESEIEGCKSRKSLVFTIAAFALVVVVVAIARTQSL